MKNFSSSSNINDIIVDNLLFNFPDWSDQDILAEKWISKHVFEDNDLIPSASSASLPVSNISGSAIVPSSTPIYVGANIALSNIPTSNQLANQNITTNILSISQFSNLSFMSAILPRSLRQSLDSLKRPIEIFADSSPIGISSQSSLEDSFYSPLNSTPVPLNFLNNINVPQSASMKTTSDTDQSKNNISDDKIDENQILLPQNQVNEIYEDNHNEIPNASHATDAFLVINQPSSHDFASFNVIPYISEQVTVENENVNSFIQTPDQISELPSGTSKFLQCNKHLLKSEFMRLLIFFLQFLFEQSRSCKSSGIPDEFAPWDHVYPKGKDGLPMYNPHGKYAVKLWWLGSWKKVVVDDKIPVDVNGKPLIIGLGNEIWTMILCKAIMKVLAYSYRDSDGLEVDGFDFFNLMTNWVPEKLKIPVNSQVDYKNTTKLWSLLSGMNLRSPSTSSSSAGSNRIGSLSMANVFGAKVMLQSQNITITGTEKDRDTSRLGLG
ncbi:hypothetical protein HK096_007125, partial [Nowakowskiella sp. JEL0078]